jgi:hypothetical protein
MIVVASKFVAKFVGFGWMRIAAAEKIVVVAAFAVVVAVAAAEQVGPVYCCYFYEACGQNETFSLA